MRHQFNRCAAAVLAVAAMALAWLAGVPHQAVADASFTWARHAGADRYATAAALARAAYPTGADAVLLASGTSFPDALGGAYLAGSLDAPLLLSAPASLPAATASALQQLDAGTVYVLGGPGAVSDGVAAQVRAIALSGGRRPTVERISGPDRYATSAAIARRLPAGNIGMLAGRRTALLANGLNFPDALAGAAASAAEQFPLLITTATSLPAPISQALTGLGIQHVVVLGGPSVVAESVRSQLTGLGITSERLSGADRTATAAAIATWAVDVLGLADSRVALARGDNAGGGADALGLAALAGVRREPILLASSPTVAGAATLAWLDARAQDLAGGDLAGSSGAVSATLAQQLTAAAGGQALMAGQTVLVSADAAGAPTLNRTVAPERVSADGRYVLYNVESPPYPGGYTGPVIRDVVLGRSFSVLGADGTRDLNAGEPPPWPLPPDMRYVTIGGGRITWADLVAGRAETLARATSGHHVGTWPRNTSSDGRYSIFASDDPGLAVGDTDGGMSVFRRDNQAGTTTWIAPCLPPATIGECFPAAISGSGRYVFFISWAQGILPGVDPGGDPATAKRFLYRWDSDGGAITVVGMAPTGALADVTGVDVTADGRLAAFESCDDLVPADTNGSCDVYVRNLNAGTTQLASVSSLGTAAGGFTPAISADGAYVAFRSTLTSMQPGQPAASVAAQVFRRNLSSGATVLASRTNDGAPGSRLAAGGGSSSNPVLNSNGQVVSYWSNAANLWGDSQFTRDVILTRLG